MDKKNVEQPESLPFPLMAGMISGILSALIVGGSFYVIRYWPLPQSVEPYFGFRVGAVWGAVVGFVIGAIVAWLTDDRHFDTPA